jgi:pimeloyl-ACP methyl ester carboxylesterase
LIQPTLSLDRITEDAAEVVQYLRTRYGKEKIFVLGHSWGSLVGLQLAHRHPDWLYAYIGMGQVIDGAAGERVGYETTLNIARAAKDAKAVSELEAIAPYPNADGTLPLEKIDQERKWSVAYGGLTWGRSNLHYYFDLAQFAPEYSASDLAAIPKGSQLSLQRLLPDLVGFDYSAMTDWHCPIVIFAGRHDFTTPSVVVADWFARIHAPAKKFIWFEDSAHMIMVEEPGRTVGAPGRGCAPACEWPIPVGAPASLVAAARQARTSRGGGHGSRCRRNGAAQPEDLNSRDRSASTRDVPN